MGKIRLIVRSHFFFKQSDLGTLKKDELVSRGGTSSLSPSHSLAWQQAHT